MNYNIGDVVWYFPFGSKFARRVLVRAKDINKGRPCFDGTEILEHHYGSDVWGYDSQIVKVERVTVNQ